MNGAIGGAGDEGAADPEFGLDRKAGKIFRLNSAEVSASQTFSGVDAM